MRDYAKIMPTFWTGETGKALRGRGFEAVIVAVYLMTSPHSNMLGLYYQPVLYMAHETGLGIEGASKGLQACVATNFCSFDKATEMVWVHEMAAYQIASELSPGDKRCKGIQKDYDALPNCPFLGAFFDRYSDAFHLKKRRALPSPIEAPSKPGTGEGAGEGTGIVSPPAPGNTAPAAPEKPKPEKSDPQGTRLPTDLVMSPEWAAFCETERPDLDPKAVFDGFRDFWIGKAGKDARKADWHATWRNWCRSQKPGTRKPGDSARPHI